jgi:hypothetical protein
MTGADDGPTPPEGLPDELVSSLRALDAEDLRKTIIHARELLNAEKESAPTVESKPGEDILEVTHHQGYTEVVKRVPCGEECSECPHGPYLYHVTEERLPDGDTELYWKFLGEVDDDE